MNYEGKAKHFSQLLGQGFIANVNHFKFKDDKGKEVVIANFRGPDGLTIRPPRVEQMDENSALQLLGAAERIASEAEDADPAADQPAEPAEREPEGEVEKQEPALAASF